MIAYFDTSAFVPLLVDEPTSVACLDFWNGSDVVAASRVLYAEAAAAVARAQRVGRLDAAAVDRAFVRLDRYWLEIHRLEVDEAVVHAAAGRARDYGLRGYGAVHCASAELLADDDLVAVSGDRELLAAWTERGIPTFDPNQR